MIANFRCAALLLASLLGVIGIGGNAASKGKLPPRRTISPGCHAMQFSASGSNITMPRRDSATDYVGSLRRLDTHVRWTRKPRLELSVAGKNLLIPVHAEFHDA